MNIYDLRFVNNKTDEIIHVEQFGESEREIDEYWEDYFKEGTDDRKAPFAYVDCVLKTKVESKKSS